VREDEGVGHELGPLSSGAKRGSRSSARSMILRTTSTDGASTRRIATLGALARSATFCRSQPQRTAWCRAEEMMAWWLRRGPEIPALLLMVSSSPIVRSQPLRSLNVGCGFPGKPLVSLHQMPSLNAVRPCGAALGRGFFRWRWQVSRAPHLHALISRPRWHSTERVRL
jgi:hypothetical protein